MHDALKGLTPLTYDTARQLKTQSEQLFALGFLSWFHNWPHLYAEPFRVSVPGVGNTIPDFATEYCNRDMVLYEVTLTKNTLRKPRKVKQQRVYRAYTGSRKHVLSMEINGGALQCIDTTMDILEQMYRGKLNTEIAQKEIDTLGRNTQVFQTTLLRELGRI
jgi:hypothetical protein